MLALLGLQNGFQIDHRRSGKGILSPMTLYGEATRWVLGEMRAFDAQKYGH
jgi:hypothetical protein